MKKKMKLYLDTSVISYLDASDTPEKMADTLNNSCRLGGQ